MICDVRSEVWCLFCHESIEGNPGGSCGLGMGLGVGVMTVTVIRGCEYGFTEIQI